LKPERWGSPLVQEKYREEKACGKRHPYRIIIIIIIIIIITERLVKSRMVKHSGLSHLISGISNLLTARLMKTTKGYWKSRANWVDLRINK